jgi:hypothetical protein
MAIGVTVRRREQAEWRRQRLLDAALEIFVEKGIERASVRDIARAAAREDDSHAGIASGSGGGAGPARSRTLPIFTRIPVNSSDKIRFDRP